MKLLENKDSYIVNSSNLTASSFGIKDKNLSKIIHIVENDIYTDKILAVIREYSCNAYDANVENGKRDVPITVSLPSSLCPEFKVRDNGKGLSEEQIHEIYVSYGESTKTASDDYVGQLGIGSKSGFAYGDNFIVTSYNNGVKTVYNAVKSDSKREIVKLYSEPSGEPSGIEVTVPVVNLQDIRLFKNKCIEFFQYWNVYPNIIGATDEERIVNKSALSGNGWRVLESRKTYNACVYAVMGNIPYPINASSVLEKVNSWEGSAEHADVAAHYRKNKKLWQFVFNNNVDIEFPIGSLQFAPSREALQYTDHTLNAICKRMMVICSELGDSFVDAVTKQPTLWNCKFTFNNLVNANRHTLYHIVDIYESVADRLVFNNTNIVTAYSNVHKWDASLGKIADLSTHVDANGIPLKIDSVVKLHSMNSYYAKFSYGESANVYRNQLLSVESYAANYKSSEVAILINDLNRKTHIKKCVQWMMEQNEYKVVYEFTFKNDAVKKSFFDEYDFAGATILSLKEVFEKYKPFIPKRNSVKLEDETVLARNMGLNFCKKNDTYYSHYSWYKNNVDLKQTSGYYVDVSTEETVTINDVEVDSSIFFHTIYKLNLSQEIKVEPDTNTSNPLPVYGFGKKITLGKKFKRNKNNWVNFVEFLQKNHLAGVDKNRVLYSLVKNEYFSHLNLYSRLLRRIGDKLSSDHLLNEAFAIVPRHELKTDLPYKYVSVIKTLFKISDGEVELYKGKLQEFYTKLADAYPMLVLATSEVGNNRGEDVSENTVQTIVDYINTVDKSKSVA